MGTEIEIPRKSLDDAIVRMASCTMGEVVRTADESRYVIAAPCNEVSARWYLVCRLYTDAIFNNDLRALTMIVNRVDGGVPKDTEVAFFSTDFGDCINAILDADDSERFKVTPDDTVMEALCKKLYQMATEDIYWDDVKKRKVRPSDLKKTQRDQAMRLIVERTGGRKTKIEVQEKPEAVELNDWVVKALRGGTE